MKFYLAGRWANQENLKVARERLIQLGYTVTSRWLDRNRDVDPTPEFFKQHGAKIALQDFNDIYDADALVLDLLGGRGRRSGMMTEFGYAWAKEKMLITIGEPDDVFTQLAHIKMPSWQALFDYNFQPCNRRANDIQVAGNHYLKYGTVQPWDTWFAWKLNPFQAMILKYIVRYRDKNGIEDLEKAKHYLEKLIEEESK